MAKEIQILTRGANVPQEYFVSMDKLDEAKILQGLEGSGLVYHFKDGKKRDVYGLSIIGVREAIREAAKKAIIFREYEPVIEMKENGVLAKVKVAMFKLQMVEGRLMELPMGEAWGVVFQPSLMKVHKKVGGKLVFENGKPVYELEEDRFAVQKAHSKAFRNAVISLLPQKVVERIIKKALKKGNVEEVEPEPATAGQLEVLRMLAEKLPKEERARFEAKIEKGLTFEEAEKIINWAGKRLKSGEVNGETKLFK